jgi:hypothetical protein
MNRLKSAPMTDEDYDAWDALPIRWVTSQFWHVLYFKSRQADTADAELMFQAQRVPCVLSVRRWDEGPEEPKIYLRGGKRVGTLEGSGIEIHEIEQATWHREQT